MVEWSDEYYSQLEQRLRALLSRAEGHLRPTTRRWIGEFLDAGEYGLAVETAAEDLPPTGSADLRELAGALLAEAQLMNMTGDSVDRLRRLAGSGQ